MYVPTEMGTCLRSPLPEQDKRASMAAITVLSVITRYAASFDAPAFQNSTGRGPGALIVGKGE